MSTAANNSPATRKPKFVVRHRHGKFGGFVVVNSQTNMQVVGPFGLREVAEAAARKRNGK